MATWDIARVREQGVSFAVAAVRDSVLTNHSEGDDLIVALSSAMGMPVVLLGARQHRLYGRQDIVKFLRNVDPRRLPWECFHIAA